MGTTICIQNENISLKKTKTFSEIPNKLKRSNPIRESIISNTISQDMILFNSSGIVSSEFVLLSSGILSSSISSIDRSHVNYEINSSNNESNLSLKINSEISSNKKSSKNKSSLFNRQFDLTNYEEKLLNTIQINFSNSKVIHLD